MGRMLTRQSRIGLAGLLALTLLAGPGMSSPAWAQLASLKTVPIPEPLNLGVYVVNRDAAIQLGKALYWDMQVGSDGVQACGTCHFHAGADSRAKNQLNPGTLAGDKLFGNNLLGLPAPTGGFGLNVTLTGARFPFHKLRNKHQVGEPLLNPANVISDCNDVCSSQGVILKDFVDIVPGNPVDLGVIAPDPDGFSYKGTNVRRVEPRNTPTVINAVFNFSNFMDGRGNNIFNGGNPFGPADPRNHVIIAGTTGLASQRLLLRQSSLASQAVGPPLSFFEMSWRGRTFPKIGKKMLSLKPLAQQKVHPQDSILGPIADNVAGTGLKVSYATLIKQAFNSRYWKNTAQIVTFDANGNPSFRIKPVVPLTTSEYTQMEANFAFFFGLAMQAYESTLVADDSPFDRFMEGAGSQTTSEAFGMGVFNASCTACHAGAAMTDATVIDIQGADLLGAPQPLNLTPLAASEFMPFQTGNGLYDSGFHNNAVRPAGSTNPADPEYVATNEDIGRGGVSDFKDPASGIPFPLSFGRLGLWKKGAYPPPTPPWTATFYTNFVPPLPFGFNGTQTSPFPNRTADFGAIKTPGLRNIWLTGPYFHNGGQGTLMQVVDFLTRGGDFPQTNLMDLDPAIQPIPLLQGIITRQTDLVNFMMSLTDPRVKFESAPFDHPEIFVPIDARAPVSPGSRAGFLANPTMFQQVPAVGFDGRMAEGLMPLGTFLNLNPMSQ